MITFSIRQWSDEELSPFSERQYLKILYVPVFFRSDVPVRVSPRLDEAGFIMLPVRHPCRQRLDRIRGQGSIYLSRCREHFFFQFYILSYFTFMFIHVNSVVKMWAVENMHFSLKKTLFGYTDVTCN